MAYLLTGKTTIGGYEFNYAHRVKIKSTWRDLGDTCTIKLPNLKSQLEKAISVGDAVKVELGYDGNNNTEFEGYVSSIKPNTPFELTCEDELFNLKRKSVGDGKGKSWRSITLLAVLKDLLNGIDTTFHSSIPDITLSPFRIEKGVTIAQVLQEFKKDYLLTAYFRDKRLYVGLPYLEFTANENDTNGRFAAYDLQRNVVSENLTYRKKEDVKLKAKAISILKDGSKLEVEVGDSDGEQRTLTYRNITSESALKQMAEQELDKYKYEGYKGKFKTFGIPHIIHSGTVDLTDSKYPSRQGRYLVRSIVTEWGNNGFRRNIELDKKV